MKVVWQIVLLSLAASTADAQLVGDGLILDLDAERGVEVEDGDRVVSWVNQVSDFPAKDFVKQDQGRHEPGSGRPAMKRDVPAIGGHHTVVFKRQELVNHEEDAFDHLITGNGYTWFAVICVHKQVVQLKDVNSFFGNLRNGGNYEGLWGNVTDDNRVWIGSRNGITFGRWDQNNPMVLAPKPLQEGRYYVVAGRMGAGTGKVPIEVFINDPQPVVTGSFPVNPQANASKLAIGQERDATNHPGKESFDGELARFLMYEHPLTDDQLKQNLDQLKQTYSIEHPGADADPDAQDEPVARTPEIDGPWWRICEMPDLGDLSGPEPRRQNIVDHGFIQAQNGKWQLWACMRGTAVSRLLYGWQGDSLEAGPWTARGIVARAQQKYGEQIRIVDGKRVEAMQAPFFLLLDGVYHCFYNSAGIRLMTSRNGVDYERTIFDDTGTNLLYPDGGRDVMVLKIGDTFYSYSTISTRDGRGYVNLKTSPDLRHWSASKVVCEGGRAGVGPVTAESPFVVALDGYYYLFRASSITFKTYVYRSKDPAYFGVDDDRFLIATLPIKAPEIVHHDDKWYISDLSDFQGIKLARLRWKADAEPGD